MKVDCVAIVARTDTVITRVSAIESETAEVQFDYAVCKKENALILDNDTWEKTYMKKVIHIEELDGK